MVKSPETHLTCLVEGRSVKVGGQRGRFQEAGRCAIWVGRNVARAHAGPGRRPEPGRPLANGRRSTHGHVVVELPIGSPVACVRRLKPFECNWEFVNLARLLNLHFSGEHLSWPG